MTEPREHGPDSGGQQAGIEPQQQQPPGLTSAMFPQPDHGEESYQGSGKLAGMRALITGGDSGIGRAVAIAYAREGADVAINYLEVEQPDAEETLRWVEKAGTLGVGIAGDLTDADTCRSVVDSAAAQLGGLDILVNNAGFHFSRDDAGTIGNLQQELVERVVRTNLLAPLWLCQAALPYLSEGSCIINTSRSRPTPRRGSCWITRRRRLPSTTSR